MAQIAFHSRLVAFWQNRVEQQQRALDFLLENTRHADSRLKDVLAGKAPQRQVPPVPAYSRLAVKNGYFRLDDKPVMPFGMLYNHAGPLLRWFENGETDYGTELVAGATRHDVERHPSGRRTTNFRMPTALAGRKPTTSFGMQRHGKFWVPL